MPRQSHFATRSSEAGQAVIFMAFLMAVTAGLVALVVDIGFLLHERRDLQNAADAAALAGSRMLPDDPDQAIADAEDYAAKNGIMPEEIVSIDVASTHVANDTIRVTVRRDRDYTFARLIGPFTGDTAASADALAGSTVGAAVLAPFAVEQSVFAGLGAGDTTTLKYNATSVENGNFLPLALDLDGGSEYRENVKLGSSTFLCSQGNERPECSSTAETQTGNMVGPTKQALNWIMSNTVEECDTFAEAFSEDPLDPDRAVLNSTCNRFAAGAASYRVFLVPVINDLCNGHCTVTVLEFALFFVESYSCSGGGQGNSCDLVGRYVQANSDIQGIIGEYDANSSVNFVRLVK